MSAKCTLHTNYFKQTQRLRAVLLSGLASLVFSSAVFAAPDLPEGEEVAHGSATISRNGKTMVIDQETGKVVINWQDFSVGEDNTVDFKQNASDIALNRVISDNPSFIYGNVTADGHVFLVNQNGILFSSTSRVDAAGLVASTLDIADEDFLAGNYTFSGTGGSVINQGEINIYDGGYAALLGAQAINEGVITAKLGTVALASGERVSFDLNGDSLINFSVSEAAVNALVANRGLIRADGGRVFLSARSAGDLAATVVNNEGVIEANSIEERDGKVFLVAQGGGIESSGDIDVSGEGETDGGKITIDSDATTIVMGDLDASSGVNGGQGGSVKVTGDLVGVSGSNINASGYTGGGEILIGGDYQGNNANVRNSEVTFIGSDVTLTADAIVRGNGGKVIIWADDTTRFYGNISATGGSESGDGGFVEVSGKQYLKYAGFVDTTAANGAVGTLLLDPFDIDILDGTNDGDDVDGSSTSFAGNPSGGIGTVLQADTSPTQIYESELENIAATTNIRLEASNDITINSLTTDGELALLTQGGQTVEFIADADGDGFGDFSMDAADIISTAGASVTFEGVTITLGGISTSGGDVNATATRNIVANGDITTTGGNITMLANAGGVSGTFQGIDLNTAILNVTGGAGNGIISLTGTGGDTAGNNHGVQIRNNSDLIASNGAITITGTAGGGTSSNWGVYINSGLVTSVDGDIAINGVGAGANGGNLGTYIQNSDILSTGTGINAAKISIDGTGANGADTNYGAILHNTNVTSDDGDILITGLGGNGTTDNIGVVLRSGAVVTSTGTATITIDGTGGTGTTGNYGVDINGAGTTVTSADGDIDITGQGGSDGTGGNNLGVNIATGAVVSSTGTGINAATITLDGTGGSGTASNIGVNINGASTQITSVDGDIQTTGQGAGTVAGSNNIGVAVSGGSVVSSTGTGANAATITLNGTGGNGTNGNYGVSIGSTGTQVTSVDGDIQITGQGAGTGTSNYGVAISSGADILSTGAGADAADVTIDGTGGSGANDGVYILSAGTVLSSVAGAIDITGDSDTTGYGLNITAFSSLDSGSTLVLRSIEDIFLDVAVLSDGTTTINADSDLNGTGELNLATTGSVTTTDNELNISAADIVLAGAGSLDSGSTATTITATNDRSIGLGTAAGDMSVTDAELANITANGLEFITTNAGAIAVNQTTAANTGSFGELTLTSGSSIAFGAGGSQLAGALDATAATGAITQSGNLVVGGISSFTTTTANQNITLADTTNDFNGTVSVNTNGATGDVDLDAEDIDFATSSVGGLLNATADTGAISQSGGNLTVGGAATFTTTAANQNITLADTTNDFNGTVSVNTNGATGDVDLDAEDIDFATSSVGGLLNATADTGAISQSGGNLTVGGAATFTTTAANQNITLADTTNDFNGTVSVNTNGATGDVDLDAEDIDFATSSVGGDLTATAATGGITQVAASTISVDDAASFTTSADDQTIVLGENTNTFGSVSVNTDDTNNDDNGDATVNGTALNFATSNVGGDLTATAATGGITQVAASTISVDDAASFTTSADDQTIVLGENTNTFGSVSVNTDDTNNDDNGDATVNGTALNFATSNVGGDLTATAATGGITQVAASTISVDDAASFTTSADDQTIVLGENTNTFGSVSVNTDDTNDDDNGDATVNGTALNFATSNVGGDLTATAATGGITQVAASTISVDDAASFTTSADDQTIVLGENTNTFGSVSVNTDDTNDDDNGDATVNGTALNFATSNVGGDLTATAATGGITQVAASTISVDDAASFTTSADDQTIVLGENTNTFGSVSVNTDDTNDDDNGDATVNGTALNFATSNVGGDLTATAATGGITQVAASTISVDDAASFTTSADDQTIVLGENTNTFGSVSVNTDDTNNDDNGDATVNGTALNFATSNVGGDLTATAATGGITQVAASTISVDDAASFTTSADDQTIVLGENTNTFGSVSVNTDDTNNDDNGDATVNGTALNFATSNVGGDLTATAATGGITQVAASTISVDDAASFTTSADDQTIVLGENTNTFGSVSVNTDDTNNDDNGDATVNGTALNFATSNVGGDLTATAATGGITQVAASTISVDDAASFTTSADDQTIVLGENTNTFGSVSVNTDDTNDDDNGDATVNGTALNFATSNVGGDLTATAATGGITQVAASTISVDDAASFTTSADDQTIVLGENTNTFGSVSVNTDDTNNDDNGDATVNGTALNFATSNVGGDLTATAATGGITQVAASTISVDDAASFTTSADDQTIVLGENTNTFGSVSVNTDDTNDDDNGDATVNGTALNFATSNVGGDLTATAATGGITQVAASTISVDDAASFTTSADDQTIVLGENTNTFGSVSVNTDDTNDDDNGDATVNGTALNFATSNVGGDLTATAATGGITQVAASTISVDDAASFTTSADDQTIVLGENTNTFGSVSVNTDDTNDDDNGDATVNGTALNFATSNVGGDLTAGSLGAITDSGTLVIDGTATFNADTNPITVVLDEANNDFNVITFGGTGSFTSIEVFDTNALSVTNAQVTGAGSGDVDIAANDGLTITGTVSTAVGDISINADANDSADVSDELIINTGTVSSANNLTMTAYDFDLNGATLSAVGDTELNFTQAGGGSGSLCLGTAAGCDRELVAADITALTASISDLEIDNAGDTILTRAANFNTTALTLLASTINDVDATDGLLGTGGFTMTTTGAIGTSGNPLNTAVNAIDVTGTADNDVFLVGSGGTDYVIDSDLTDDVDNVYIQEAGNVTISGVLATGNIVVDVTAAGDLTVDEAISNTDGNILLQTFDGDITLNQAVDSNTVGTNGHISILAGDDDGSADDGIVTQAFATGPPALDGSLTADGNIDVEAVGGISMADGTSSTATGNIIYQTSGTDTDITVSQLSGVNVYVNAVRDILDAGDTGGEDISATNAVLVAGSDIGLGSDALETAVTTLTAQATNDGVYISETDGLAVNTVATFDVSRVDTDGTVTAESYDGSLSDTSAGSNVVIDVTAAGDLTISHAVSNTDGNILLQTFDGDITLNQAVDSNTVGTNGHISILAGDDDGSADDGIVTQAFATGPPALDGSLTADGNIDVEAVGGISMADGTSSTATGNIIYQTSGTDTDITVSQLSGVNVYVNAVRDILDAGDTGGEDISATNAVLVAGSDIGLGSDALETAVTTLTAQATNDGVYISETDGLAVNTVATFDVSRVDTDGTVTAESYDGSLTDTSAGSNVVIDVTAAGDLTVDHGISNTDGNILLQTFDGDITLNQAVDSNTVGTNGHISILAGDDDGSADDGIVTQAFATGPPALDGSLTADGNIDVEAVGGISMADGTSSTATGNIIYQTSGTDTDITVSQLSGVNVYVNAVRDILDAGDTGGEDISATNAVLVAGSDIGLGSDALETAVTTLTAQATNDGVYISETDGLAVNTVATFDVSRVDTDGTVTAESYDGSLTDTSAGSNVVIDVTAAGDLTISHAVSNTDGNILLQTFDGDITLNQAVDSNTVGTNGHISILAGDDDGSADDGIVTQAFATGPPALDGSLTADGNIDVEAVGGISMADGTSSTATGNIIYQTSGTDTDITVSQLSGVNVYVNAVRDILDAGDTGGEDISATNAVLVAGSDIGLGSDALETAVTTLTAQATNDGVYISETDGLAVNTVATFDVSRVDTDGTVTAESYDGSLTDTSAGSNVVIDVTAAGDLTISHAVSNTDGNILLQTFDGDITLNQAVDSNTVGTNGHISILAGDDDGSADDGIVTQAFATGPPALDGSLTADGNIDVEAVGGISMADGTSSTATGNIIYQTSGTDTDITVSQLSGVNVYVNAVRDILDAGDTGGEDISATNAVLVAGSDIGLGSDALETAVTTLTAQATNDGIYISETDGLAVNTVATFDVSRVDTDGTVTAESYDGSLTDTSAGSNVVIDVTAAGDLTISHAVSNTDGNILLQTFDGDITLNQAVDSNTVGTNGHISILAGDDDGSADDGIVTQAFATGPPALDGSLTADGNIDVEAVGGISMADGTSSTATGNIIYQTSGTDTDITVSQLSGVNVYVNAVRDILDAGDTGGEDISATNAVLVAGSDIGLGSDALETAVTTLTAQATNDGIYISETDGLAVNTVATFDVSRVDTDGTVTAESYDGSLTDTSAGSNVVIDVTAAGDLTVDHGISNTDGNILLQTFDGDITLNQAVDSNTVGTNGHISILAGDDDGSADDGIVTQAFATGPPALDGSLTADGNIDVEAVGGISMADGTSSTATGNIIYQTSGTDTDITVSQLSGVNVYVNAVRDILDAGDTGGEDISATNAVLVAGSDIGLGSDALETAVTTLTAQATNDGVYISETDGLAVNTVATFDVSRVDTDGTVTAESYDGSLTDTSAGSNVVIDVTAAGDLTISHAVSNTDGNILLQTFDGTLTINEAVSANTAGANGHVSVIAGDDDSSGDNGVSQGINGDITADGSIDVYSDNAISMADGAVTQSTGTSTDGNAGNIAYQTAAGAFDITLGQLNGTNVYVDAGRDILDAGNSHTDVVATNVQLEAGTDIGKADGTGNGLLEIEAGTLAAQSGADMFIDEVTDSLIIDVVGVIGVERVALDATTATQSSTAFITNAADSGSDMIIRAAGALDIDGVVNATDQLLLQALGGDLTVDATVDAGSNASLIASGGVTQTANGDVTVTGTGTLDVEAEGGDIDMADGAVSDANGNIRYVASNDIILGLVDSAADVSIEAGNDIIDTADTSEDLDVIGVNVQLEAGGNIGEADGTGNGLLEIEAGTLALDAGADAFVDEITDGLIVDIVGVIETDRVLVSNLTTDQDSTAFTVDALDAGSDLVIRVADGLAIDGSVNAGAQLLLEADNGDIDVDATVDAGSNASLIANGSVNQTANGDITVTGTGTLDVEAEAGDIDMADGAVSDVAGNVRYVASNDIILGLVDSDADVSIDAGNDIIDTADTSEDLDVIGVNVQLEAGGNIGEADGTGNGLLEIEAGTLAASAGTGDLFVDEITDGLIVDIVGVIDTNRVGVDNGTSAQDSTAFITNAADSGSDMIIRAAGALDIDGVVNATDQLLLQALGGDLTVDATVDAGSNASLIASGGVTQTANGDVTVTGTGTLDVEAEGGDIDMADGAVSDANGNIRYVASNDIILGLVDSAADVSIEAGNDIIDTADTSEDLDVIGVNVQLEAGGNIGEADGTGNGLLEIEAGTLALDAGADAFVDEITDGLIVDIVGVIETDRVLVSNLTTDQDSTAFTVDALDAGSDLVIRVADGLAIDGSVNAGAQLLLEADNGDIDVDATVDAGSNASVIANGSVNQTANGDITVTGTGTLDVEAEAGDIDMADGAVSDVAGNVRYVASNDIILGLVDSDADVSIDAGNDIIDTADTSEDLDVIGVNVQLEAGGNIGEADGTGNGLLEIEAGTLAASAGTGDLFVDEITDGLIVDIVGVIDTNRVGVDNGTSAQDSTAFITNAADSGSDMIIRAAGALDIDGVVNATDQLLLQALGGDLTVDATVDAGSNASLIASGGVTQTANGDVTVTGTGTLDVEAEGGDIDMADGAVSDANGNIRYVASNDIILGLVDSAADVSIEAGNDIIDTADTSEDLDVIGVNVQLEAGGNIGEADGTGNGLLEIEAGTLALDAGADAFVDEITDGLIVDIVGVIETDRVLVSNLTTDEDSTAFITNAADSGSDMIIRAAGALDIDGVVNATDQLLLQALGGDLTVDATVDAGSNASLIASGGVTQTANGDVTVTGTGTLDVEAEGGDIDMADGAVSDANGNIRYVASNDIILGLVDSAADVSIEAGNDIIDTADTSEDLDVIGVNVQLEAGGNIGEADGTGNGLLEIEAGTLALDAGADAFVDEITDGLIVDIVGVIETDRVLVSNLTTDQDSTAFTVDALDAGSDLVIRVADGLAIDGSVNAGAQLLLEADNGDIDVDATVDAGSNASVIANGSVNQTANGDITVTGTGTLDVEAEAGDIDMADGAVSDVAGNVRYVASNDIILGLVDSDADVSIDAGNDIIDTADTSEDLDVIGVNVQLEAGGNIGEADGTGNGLLEIEAGTLAASAGTGDLFVDEITDGLIVDIVGVIDTNRVGVDNGTSAQDSTAFITNAADSGSDMIIRAAGALDIDGVVNATDQLLLQALGGDLTVDATVDAGSNASLIASGGVTQTANGDVTVTGTGTLDVEAEGGDIDMADGAVSDANGNIRYVASNDIILGLVDSAADVSIEAGNDIIDTADTSEDLDVIGVNVQLEAGGNIGEADGTGNGLLEIEAGTLALDAGADAFVDEITDGLIVDIVGVIETDRVLVSNLTTDQDSTAFTVDALDAGSDLVIRVADGLAIDGSVNAGAQLLLEADNGDIDVDATVDAGSNASVIANGSVNQTANGDITVTGTGTLDVEAEAGDIDMADGAVTDVNGNIRYLASSDIYVGQIDSDADVLVDAGGSIFDSGDASGVDLIADNLQLVAVNSIGQAAGNGDIETTVDVLAALATNGDVYIEETDALEIGSIAANEIDVLRVGVNNATTNQASSLLNGVQAELEINIEAVTQDIEITQLVDSNNANIVLTATDGGIDQSIATGIVRADAGDVSMTAGNGDILLQLVSADGNTVNLTASDQIRTNSDTPGDTNVVADILNASANDFIGTTAGVFTDPDNTQRITTEVEGAINVTLASSGTVAIDNTSTDGEVDVVFNLQQPNNDTVATSVWVRNTEGLNASGLDFAVAAADVDHLEANLQLIASNGDLSLNVIANGADANDVDLVAQWMRFSAPRGAFVNGDGSRFTQVGDGLSLTADDLVIVTGGDLGVIATVDRLDITGTGLYQVAPAGTPGTNESADLDIELSKRDTSSATDPILFETITVVHDGDTTWIDDMDTFFTDGWDENDYALFSAGTANVVSLAQDGGLVHDGSIRFATNVQVGAVSSVSDLTLAVRAGQSTGDIYTGTIYVDTGVSVLAEKLLAPDTGSTTIFGNVLVDGQVVSREDRSIEMQGRGGDIVIDSDTSAAGRVVLSPGAGFDVIFTNAATFRVTKGANAEGDLIIISARNVIMETGTAILADGSVLIGADNITGSTVIATGAQAVTGDMILYNVRANDNNNGIGSVVAYTNGESAGEKYRFDFGDGEQRYAITGAIILGRQDVLNTFRNNPNSNPAAAIRAVDVDLSAASNIRSGWIIDYDGGELDTDMVHIIALNDMSLNARDGVVGGSVNIDGNELPPTEQTLRVNVGNTMAIGAGQHDDYGVSANLVGTAVFVEEIDYVPGLIVFNEWGVGGALLPKFVAGTSIDTINYTLQSLGNGLLYANAQQAAVYEKYDTHNAVWDANMAGGQPKAVPAVWSSDGTGINGGVNDFLSPDPIDAVPEQYEVVTGDTLWAIAGRYLGDPLRWKEIWKLTKGIENPDIILPGQVIRLKQEDIERLKEIKELEDAEAESDNASANNAPENNESSNGEQGVDDQAGSQKNVEGAAI